MPASRLTFAACLVFESAFLLASCAPSHSDEANEALARNGSSSKGAAPTDTGPVDEDTGLVGTIVSIAAQGDLCPSPPNGDFGKDLHRGNYGYVEVDFPKHAAACADPDHASGQPCPTEPKCTVTLELEVPTGTRMSVPVITWVGSATGAAQPATVRRTYSFDGGDRATTADEPVTEGDIRLRESGLAAFSPTCSNTSRVRLTAELVAHRASSEIAVQINGFIVTPSERFGTVFKSCSSSQPLGTTGRAGDWCNGPNHRPCNQGLVCEFQQPPASAGRNAETTVDMATAQGLCVDPKVPASPSGLQDPCGGVRQITCKDNRVCWHVPEAEPEWLGICLPREGGDTAPCEQGTPSLGCATGFVCESSTLSCKRARGMLGDTCLGPEFPSCIEPLFCRIDTCEAPHGLPGDPCGSDQYPACAGSTTCVDGHCRNTTSGFNGPCDATRTCRKGLMCVDGHCMTESSSSTLTSED